MLPSARASPRTKSEGKFTILKIYYLAREARQKNRPAAGEKKTASLEHNKQFVPFAKIVKKIWDSKILRARASPRTLPPDGNITIKCAYPYAKYADCDVVYQQFVTCFERN